MSDSKVISIRALFNAIVKGEAASGTLQNIFAEHIKIGTNGADDAEGRKAVRAALRKECGLPEKAPVRIITEGKQAPKEPRENRFDVLFHRAGNLAYPKSKPGPVAKGNKVEAKAAKGSTKAEGITHRTQAYALVLQDLAACKTAQTGLSSTEVATLAKLLPKLHDWATLEK